MKYTCKICGYVYDEEEQGTAFEDLPDSWRCPVCGAAKTQFEPQGQPQKKKMTRTTLTEEEGDMHRLSAAELSALCSNLARGCEKQYKQKESELFTRLADYFAEITPAVPEAETADMAECIQNDLKTGYPAARAVSDENQDRGALRVCTWGEKVTNILDTLLSRYEEEGETFLADTDIWVCTSCGFVFVGENPPEICPVCKVPAWKFEKVEGGVRA